MREDSLISIRLLNQLRNEAAQKKPMRTIGWLSKKSYLRDRDVYQAISLMEDFNLINYWTTRFGRVEMTLLSEIKIEVNVQVHRKNRSRVINWYRVQSGISTSN
jgi:hypothetical protein